MISLTLNSSFLLRLSPYLAVGIVLLLAILVVFRQIVPGRKHAGSGCCDAGGDANETDLMKSTGDRASTPAQQDLPLCGSCKGCRVKDCPGLSPSRPTTQKPGKDRF